ncbi:MAG: S8 family serine peptidase [Chloroflexota bacterium]
MTRKAHILSLLFLFLAIVVLVPGYTAGAGQPAAGGYFVRVPTGSAAQLDALDLQPRLSLDYGSFQWLELSAGDVARLAASHVPYTAEPEAGKVQVLGYRFDPLAGEPTVRPEMQASNNGPGLRLVQLAGPSQDAWLQQLAAAGLRVLQYYPHHTFLVWGTPSQAAAVENLSFVRWQGAFHPAYKINEDLLKRSGRIDNVDVFFYNDGQMEATLAAISRLGGRVIQHYPSQPDKAFFDAIVQLDARTVEAVARLSSVVWLGYASPRPELDDEMSDQILAGNYTGGVPFPGYNAFLDDLGVDGTGVIWSITDTGVDYDHPDLGSHIVGGYTYPGVPAGDGPGDDCGGSLGGHGTHVAGIVGGNASTGLMDASGFLYGLGMAPAYSIFAQNSLCGAAWPPAGGWQEHSKRGVLGNAIGGNNSWTTGEGTNHGYQSSERTHDIMVRDGNFDTTTVAEPFIEVFSAGNSGPGSQTLTAPKEGKNLIIIASSKNYRIGSIDSISTFSSRGPARDGRFVPTVATPGEEIASSANDTGGSCATPGIPGTGGLYAYCSGTSMAAPHASGSIVLIAEWWRTFNGGADPSPAMAKALLVNGATDMGTPNRWNNSEGWGRIYLPDTISPDANVIYRDQLDVLGSAGEQYVLTVGVPDPTQPLKITVAWSDAPGAAGANPALVNDLNLTVDDGANTYLGNVFSGGWSTTGGTADSINNLENVFIQSPGGSSATITIDAINISGDGIPYNADTTDQDFALVCYNCALQADYTLAATPETLDICAPSNAVYDVTIGSILGYNTPVSLSASGQPAGTLVNFSVNPVTPPGSSVLTIGNTGAATAGTYTISVNGNASGNQHSDTVTLNLSTAIPGVVTLVSPANGATEVSVTPTFTWNAASQATSYDLEVATDAGFSNVVYAATVVGTSHTAATALQSETTHYWRVRGNNTCGVGNDSAVWSFTTEGIPPILLVDDDDNSPSVQATYTAALNSLALTYDVWDTGNSDNEPDATDLSPYTTVIWFTGDEYGGFAGPGAAGETALASWLDGGSRCLFISSQDYYYDRGLTTFMSTYLGVGSATSDVDQTGVRGRGPFNGLGPYTLAYGSLSNFSDRLNPGAGATVAFQGNLGRAAVAKLIAGSITTFLGYPWEALPDAASEQAVLDRFLNNCGS